jgi:hypothetical protein
LDKISGNNFTNRPELSDSNNAISGQRNRALKPSSRPPTPGLSALQNSQVPEGGHVSARFGLSSRNSQKPDAASSAGSIDTARIGQAAARNDKPSQAKTTPTINELRDVLVRDDRGEPVFESHRQVTVMHPSGQTCEAEVGLLRMSDGAGIVALKNITDKHAFDCNCHGYSIGEGRFSINDEDMQKWLDSTSLLTKAHDPQPGDLVVYRNTEGNVVHSAILTNPGMVVMAAGVRVYDNDMSKTPPGGIAGPSKAIWVPVEKGWTQTERSIEYWRPAAASRPDETQQAQ